MLSENTKFQPFASNTHLPLLRFREIQRENGSLQAIEEVIKACKRMMTYPRAVRLPIFAILIAFVWIG